MTTGRILLAVVAVCTAAGPVGCSPQADDPSLIQREDSAGVEIVEALRPLWGESSLWRIDPEPTVDLTVGGSGPNHEFGNVRAGGMVRLADGSLVVADATYRQIRLYSPEGGFLASTGRAGEGPGEFSGGITEMVGATGDTVWVLDLDGRVSVFGPDIALARTFGLRSNAQAIYDLGDGSMAVGYNVPYWARDALGTIRNPGVLWRFDTEGTRLDSITTTKGYEEYVVQRPSGNVASVATLFPKKAQVAVQEGSIFVGNAEFMEVEERTREGDLVRILRIPDYPLALSATVLMAEWETFLGGRTSSLLQESTEKTPASGTRPAYSKIIVDPSGALWLRRYRGRSEAAEPERWLVLATDGTPELEGRVLLRVETRRVLLALLRMAPAGLSGQEPGRTVRISGVLVDDVVSIDSTGLHLAESGHFPYKMMTSLEVSVGKRSHWKRVLVAGASIGILTGAVLAGIHATDCNPFGPFDPGYDTRQAECYREEAGIVAASTGAGGLLGWLIGAMIKRDVWLAVPVGGGRVGVGAALNLG